MNAEPVSSGKCKCDPVWLIVGWIAGALGIWAFVSGFAVQFGSAVPTSVNWVVLVWYFAGLLLWKLAKMAKSKGSEKCGMHSCKCC